MKNTTETTADYYRHRYVDTTRELMNTRAELGRVRDRYHALIKKRERTGFFGGGEK